MFTAECNSCGMRLEYKALDSNIVKMHDGKEVKVKSYTCPKCDEEYIVSVYDEKSDELRSKYNSLMEELNDLKELPAKNRDYLQIRILREEISECKEEMYSHDRQLKNKFLKERKRYGK